MRWAICLLVNCSNDDAADFVQTSFEQINSSLNSALKKYNINANTSVTLERVTNIERVSYEKPFSVGFWIMICVMILLVILIVIGTCLDYCHELILSKTDESLFHVRSLVDESNSPSSTSERTPLLTTSTGDDGPLDSTVVLRNAFGDHYLKQLRDIYSKNMTEGVCSRILLSFSLITNCRKLFTPGSSYPEIACLNGIRVISMFWVILGHTFLFGLEVNILENPKVVLTLVQRLSFQVVANAYFSVDSFFFLSGFLVGYLALAEMDKNQGKINWVFFYLHRFLRLTPTMLFMILLWIYVFPYMGSGPIWNMKQNANQCRDYWWTNILYINNFYPTKFSQQCAGWTWYLANDMQFYILTPFVLIFLYRQRKTGFIILCGVILSSVIINATLIWVYDLDVSVSEGLAIHTKKNHHDFTSIVYEKPYTRIIPYAVGILLGYVLYTEKRFRIRRAFSLTFVFVGWLCAITVALLVVYGLYGTFHAAPFSTFENVTYGALSRLAWSLSLSWVVYMCFYGYGGVINTLLSWSVWSPLGRLTYCSYLLHPLVILLFYDSKNTTIHYTDIALTYWFCGILLLAYGAAIIMSLVIEFPMAALEKAICKLFIK